MKAPKPKRCVICRRHVGSYAQPHDVLKGYVCAICEAQKSYSVCNEVTMGKPSQLPAFALEFEIAAEEEAQRRRALILLRYQYERTYDSTVSDEYKSPIYQNLHAFRKPLAVLHELRDLVTWQCGTHLHVSFGQKRHLSFFREEAFWPLITYLKEHEEQTIRFWGRTFCEHAQATLAKNERHACFNVWSRHATLEWRLPRFRTAEQYLAVIRFCRTTTAFLDHALDPAVTRARVLTPEHIGKQVLARYTKAVRAFEAACTSPAVPGEEERSVHV